MKRFRFSLATGLVSFATLALAQTVVITPEEEREAGTYITEQHWKSVEMPGGAAVKVGEALPPAVELREVPKIKKYRLAIVGGRTVFVDPGTRKVVRVIEK